MKEALYTIEFGDISSHAMRNGGVVVFETGRVFGGDSGYYYLGHYEVKGEDISATVNVGKHNPNLPSVWGDNSSKFTIEVAGKISGDNIKGKMQRTDKPGISIDLRFTWIANLP